MTMTDEEQAAYVKMVRALDLVVRTIRPALWPLCQPALQLMDHYDKGRRMRPCPIPQCRQASGHRCGCDVHQVRKGLRLRKERGLLCR